jgi:hypothetical protein
MSYVGSAYAGWRTKFCGFMRPLREHFLRTAPASLPLEHFHFWCIQSNQPHRGFC